ncbi:MAG: NAD(P)-dependent oxidoreductase [Olsenella sp.]|jgi:dihydroflavonol-4-reductase
MKVSMIGGTGLLGSGAARELMARGHEAATLALPPLLEGAPLPPEMKIEFGNCLEMPDDELKAHFCSCDAFIFAAGVDERFEGPAPSYDLYKKFNIDPIKRLLPPAKECGVKHAAICGSHFAYLAKTRPDMELTKRHPYIRSRIEQEEAAMSFADDSFDVAVPELPCIFGTQLGRRPVWVFLVESIARMKKNVLLTRGGTAMVTVRQVGQALAGAIERSRGGHCHPIGWWKMTWEEMLDIVQKYMGGPAKPVETIPKWMYAIGGWNIRRCQKKRGIDGGLDMVRFADIQCTNLFIDKNLGSVLLGVTDDDIDAAIGDSVKLSMAVAEGKAKTISMKGEQHGCRSSSLHDRCLGRHGHGAAQADDARCGQGIRPCGPRARFGEEPQGDGTLRKQGGP